MDEVAGDRIERKSFSELLSKPFGGGVCGDVPVADDPPTMIQDDQDAERLEVPTRDHQEVHGGDHLSVVLEEGLPVLSSSGELVSPGSAARHEARDGAFGDAESQFQEFPVDPGRSPRGVLCGHLANQSDEFAAIPPSTSVSRFPTPEEPKPRTMPTDHGLGFDQYTGLFPGRPETTEKNPEGLKGWPQAGPRMAGLKDRELLACRQEFEG